LRGGKADGTKRGKEGENKKQKQGYHNATCSLGENRLQRSRFRLGQTIMCTHEQTTKPTIHALADPPCRARFVSCPSAHTSTFLPGMSFFAHRDNACSLSLCVCLSLCLSVSLLCCFCNPVWPDLSAAAAGGTSTDHRLPIRIGRSGTCASQYHTRT